MGRHPKPINPWDVIELTCGGRRPEDIASLWNMSASTIRRRCKAEILQGRRELDHNRRAFQEEITRREGTEAIFSERFAISYVQVRKVRLASRSMIGRVFFVPHQDDGEQQSTVIRSSWDQFMWENSLWRSNSQGESWELFFSPDVIQEVISVAEPLDYGGAGFNAAFYVAVRKPLDRFLLTAAKQHLQNVYDMLNVLATDNPTLKSIRNTLDEFAPTLPDISGIGLMLKFISEVDSESERSLSKAEAGRLIREMYLVGRVLGGPF